MRIISVINLKGGVGKTFTVAQMGHILNKLYGASVLLVDNDKQGNLSKYYEAYRENQQCGAAKLLNGDKAVNDMGNGGIKQMTSAYAYPRMDIIDANMSLLQATSDLYAADGEVYKRYYPLRDAVAEDGKSYDFIIIDNPPDMDLNVVNALAVTDDVILVTSIDGFALPGLDTVKEQVE
ncbi:MAG: ParA family protein, partial [Clostridium sp.]|nr:ParA family protein [Clostridium sp.]